MREEYKIKRQGQDVILFKGLLNELHERNFQGFETELMEYKMDDEGEPLFAIAHAVCILEDGRRFGGIGDATKKNVNRNIAPHLIRMAETRAKGRAARDALNIGELVAEELEDSGDGQQKGQNQAPQKAENDRLGKRERDTLRKLIVDTGRTVEGFEDKIGKIAEIDRATGLGWTQRLQKDKDDKGAKEGAAPDEIDIDDVPGVEKGGASK